MHNERQITRTPPDIAEQGLKVNRNGGKSKNFKTTFVASPIEDLYHAHHMHGEGFRGLKMNLYSVNRQKFLDASTHLYNSRCPSFRLSAMRVSIIAEIETGRQKTSGNS